MAVTFNELSVGGRYSQNQLAELWGYKSHYPLQRGIVTPAKTNYIILFVTKDKVSDTTQYEDNFDGCILHMQGAKGHGCDKRLNDNYLGKRADLIQLFYREKHHTLFTYYGQMNVLMALINADKPSEFTLGVAEHIKSITEYEQLELLDSADPLTKEGKSKLVTHITYERNPKNRKRALEYHGYACKICGTDLNQIYGEDLADSYIEVHHIVELNSGEQEIDPTKDLLPVCPNCHRILHRRKMNNPTVEALKIRLKDRHQ